jgi:TorA maturation chaperone TorD
MNVACVLRNLGKPYQTARNHNREHIGIYLLFMVHLTILLADRAM